MKESVFIVRWKGPYPQEETVVIEDARVLYLVTGGTRVDKTEKFQYCGITDMRFRDRSRHHHRLDEITTNRQLWIGWMQYPHRYGPRREHLLAVESLIIYYWGELLNSRKASRAPRSSITLISRWFSPDWQGTPKSACFAEFPDIISWDVEQQVWKTANFDPEYADDPPAET